MVIGNGLIAKRFDEYKEDKKILIFASGVSNSKTTNPALYDREVELLTNSIRQYKDMHFAYFSTCSVYDPEERKSMYVRHKLTIEEIIQENIKHYHIFRVSNLAGHSNNPNTVLNFFFYHVKNGINFDLWLNACRNIIDIDDAYPVIDHILKNSLLLNKAVNIANPSSYPVTEIIAAIETFLKTQADYIPINKGTCFEIDTSGVNSLFEKYKISFNNDYLLSMLGKYFTQRH